LHRHILTVALLAISTSASAAPEFEWHPDWRPGSYWIVRFPNTWAEEDAGNAKIITSGTCDARFDVVPIPNMANRGVVRIEMRWKCENDNLAFDEITEYRILSIDSTSGQLREVETHSMTLDGNPDIDRAKFVRPSRIAPQVGPWDDLAGPLPPDLYFIFPALKAGINGGYVFPASPEDTNPSRPHVRQIVTRLAENGGIRLDFAQGAHPWPRSLLVHAQQPWFEVLDERGRVINEIVEVGGGCP
jgi:hypothetical protein